MANASILKEYLVALGFKDNMTNKLNKTLNQSSQKVQAFSKGLVKGGMAIASLLAVANTGIAKFTAGLVKTDDELTKYAAGLGKGKEEARQLKYALDAMGKSMEEVEASPELTKTFKQLQKDAAAVKLPDMSEGLNQVRKVQTEFLRLRQAGSYAIQWVGHYLVKYLQQPMEKLRNVFNGLNNNILKNMPEWSKKIASVMASVVNITMSIIRGATNIFKAIKKIFDMIPGEVKIFMGILAALAAFIRAGPIGKLMMIFSVLMLLVEDFFTYLDGGDSLLGGFWQWLIDIWNELNKQGGVIEKMKKAFVTAMDAITKWIKKAIEWVKDFWRMLEENGIVENFKLAFEKVGDAIGKVFEAITSIVGGFLDLIFEGADNAKPFLAWLLSDALPGIIGLIADTVGVVAEALKWFFELPFVKEIVLALIVAWGAWTAAQWLLNVAMNANPIGLIIAGIVALITAAYLLVKNWDKVSAFFKDLWDKIKAVFANIGEWFADVFSQAWEGIKNVFSTVGEFFKGIWDTIVELFTSIGTAIGSAIGDAFKSVVNAIISFAENTINGFIKAINAAIGLINKIPGVEIKKIQLLDIPRLEKGSDDTPDTFIAGDVKGKGGELVTGAKGRKVFTAAETGNIFQTLKEIAGMGGKNADGTTDNGTLSSIASNVTSIAQVLSKATSMLGTLDKGLSQTRESAAGTSSVKNIYNQQTYDMQSHYTINDTSGRPQAVAEAVDRTQQMRLRNLQGILNT